MNPNRLAGHTLPHEGKIMRNSMFDDEPGATRCSCGERSPHLPSTAARKRWHRDHKDEVRRALEEAAYAAEEEGL